MAGQRLAQPGPPAGRWPANSGWSCGKPARAANDSCHTGESRRSARATRAAQVPAVVGVGPTTSAGASRTGQQAASASSAAGSAAVPRCSRAGAASGASSAGSAQSSLGTITSAGPRPSFASCQARAIALGHVLRAGRLVHPHRVVAGEPGEVARQERPVDEVAPVLLADDDDQRHAVRPRRRERADGVAQPGGGVQVDQRRTARRGGVAGGDPDDRALVQGEDEPQVVGQAGEEGDLGGARVGEDRRHPEPAEDVERGVPDRRHDGAPGSVPERRSGRPRPR